MDLGFDGYDDDLEVLELINPGIPRQVNERHDYFCSLDELSFFKRFRLTKNTVRYLLPSIEDLLEFPDDRNNSVSPMNQLQKYSHQEVRDGEVFRNRKRHFSVNVQVVCNAEMKIIDIVARWPGSAHDATIFHNSVIKMRFDQREYQNCILLGDSAYNLRSYFLTPLLNPITHAEQRYNGAHISTRNIIERVFGVWKRRFPVLAYGCRLKVQNLLTVIVATAVLHNIARDMAEDEPPLQEDHNRHLLDELIELGNIHEVPLPGRLPNFNNTRHLFINQYFNQL